MELILNFFNELDIMDYAVVCVNILLIIFAPQVMRVLFSADNEEEKMRWRTLLLRGFNVLILVIYCYRYIYVPSEGGSYAVKALSIVVILYLAYLSINIAHYWIYRRFGRKWEFNGKTRIGETYQTRLFSLLANILVFIVTLVLVIQQLGFQSLLETSGALGIIGVMLALTQASWAPDIISGLIILNSDLFEEGDVIELDGGTNTLATVYKTKLFHTEVLNLSNNHRVMLKNAALRDHTIHNLSKFASPKGLRECLVFNIGYDTPSKKIKAMFADVFEAIKTEDLPVAVQHEYKLQVTATGDHAVSWGFFYYVTQVENILQVRRDVMEIALSQSITHNISLATPLTHMVGQMPENTDNPQERSHIPHEHKNGNADKPENKKKQSAQSEAPRTPKDKA